MLSEGLVFADRYKFIKQLGRGGFAEVWLAEDNRTGVQVAVKVYAPGAGLDDDGIKLFSQEFSLVFDMNHTNLLRPTHFDCWDRMPYLIMPLIKNGSAFKYIAEGKNMPEDECWKLLHDVAAGLAYLHEKNPPLIHQDIKPDNILIDDEGRYLITDFGISARVRSTIRKGQAQEQSGGTFAYMGPERFSATPKPIMASDVWSLGAMMFELMTGMPPFGNHGGMLQKNGAEVPIIEEDYSQELKDIVYSCVAAETWDRPSARKIEEMTYNKMHGIVMPTEPTEATVIPEETVSPASEALATNEAPVTTSPGDAQPQTEAPKKSVPLSGKKQGTNKKLIYGAIAGIIVLILAIVLFTGNSDEKSPEPEAIVEVQPAINYDSLAQIRLTEGLELVEQADTFIANHEEDKLDSQYDKVEETYLSALKAFEAALADKDSLSASISSNATIQVSTVKAKLMEIYQELEEGAQYVPEWKSRAEAIKPYIENLIENDNNNNTDNNE